MRCLVTGASGFLGSHLVRHLLMRGHEVVVLLRPQTDVWRIKDCIEQLDIVHGSMEETATLRQYLDVQPVDVIFHLAWSGVTGDQRNSICQSELNVTGSIRIWEILRDSGCKHFIGVGSQAEYGPHAAAISEEAATRPQTAYGASKLALSILLKQFCESAAMDFTWMRVFSVYGPADDVKHMVPSLVHSLLQKQRPSLTKGEQIWDYLYVEDAVLAFVLVAERKAVGIFNVGSGVSIQLRDFISTVRNSIDPEIQLGFGEVPYRKDQVMHLLADVQLLHAATGWLPLCSLNKGIMQTVDWYKNNLDRS